MLSVKSPVHEPFLEEEPLFDLWSVDVDILIEATNHEDLFIVVDWVSSEKFFWLLQWAFLPFNLIRLRVKREAVRNPSLVTTEYQNLGVAVSKGTHSVSGRPSAILID